MRDVADKETVLGYPAAPHTQAKRQWVGIQRLPRHSARNSRSQEANRHTESATGIKPTPLSYFLSSLSSLPSIPKQGIQHVQAHLDVFAAAFFLGFLFRFF